MILLRKTQFPLIIAMAIVTLICMELPALCQIKLRAIGTYDSGFSTIVRPRLSRTTGGHSVYLLSMPLSVRLTSLISKILQIQRAYFRLMLVLTEPPRIALQSMKRF